MPSVGFVKYPLLGVLLKGRFPCYRRGGVRLVRENAILHVDAFGG